MSSTKAFNLAQGKHWIHIKYSSLFVLNIETQILYVPEVYGLMTHGLSHFEPE